MNKRVTVYAPASISNLGAGFDVLGLALDRPGDIVTAELTSRSGLNFAVAGKTIENMSREESVPRDAKSNVAAYVANLLMRETKLQRGIKLTLTKGMPVGSGLGSSAASGVAAAFAVSLLLPRRLTKQELLPFIVEGERFTSGSPHADNAAPSLFGGLCLIRSYSPLDVVRLPVRNVMYWVVVHPHVVIQTREARSILPKSIPLPTAISQWGNVSGLTAALMTGDGELLRRCIEDHVAEPVRAGLIPGYRHVKEAALRSGALGCSISGSGPSVFAVASSRRMAVTIGVEMQQTFLRESGLASDVFVSKMNMKGATIMRRSST